jgi:hypothetical protein
MAAMWFWLNWPPMAGTDPLAELSRLRLERTVRMVALDPNSPSATLVEPLTRAGIQLTQLASHDLAVAQRFWTS